MKATVFALPVLGLMFGLAAPVSASSDHLVTISNGKTTIVAQQDKCKEDEKWNEETQKCEKKEG